VTAYWRPIPQADPARPPDALPLAGGPLWFSAVERLGRGALPAILPAAAAPAEILARLTAPRPPVAGLSLDRPRLMGVVNVTPDSFSDGGRFASPAAAAAQGRRLAAEGADLLDIGAESTRPGAAPTPPEEEAARLLPVLALLGGAGPPLSVDTRRAAVAAAALGAGARLVNDVSALGDPGMAAACGTAEGVVLMHMRGEPATMQDDPRYGDVLLDVYDHLAARLAAAEAAGLARARLLVDPGIGFGKTLQHNVTVLRRLSLYHALGCAIVIGASRKRFLGALGGAAEPRARGPGSLAAALWAAAQGVQILRVHDVAETRQALSVQMAMVLGVA
jgi:dihydropteroate synthase